MNKNRLQMQRRKPDFVPLMPTNQVEDKPRNRLNQYTCSTCGGVITTIDRDYGTTPMMLVCRAMEGCGGSMFSAMYRVEPNLTPEWEWYKPAKLPRGANREHVQMGGLLIRKLVNK